jgi:hypothetical protein
MEARLKLNATRTGEAETKAPRTCQAEPRFPAKAFFNAHQLHIGSNGQKRSSLEGSSVACLKVARVAVLARFAINTISSGRFL